MYFEDNFAKAYVFGAHDYDGDLRMKADKQFYRSFLFKRSFRNETERDFSPGKPMKQDIEGAPPALDDSLQQHELSLLRHLRRVHDLAAMALLRRLREKIRARER